MTNVWLATLASTVAVSLVSFAGIFLLSLNGKRLRILLSLLVCFAAGALLGNSFFHLLPETYENITQTALASWLVVGGFLLFFVIELFFHSRSAVHKTLKTSGYLSLYSDCIHNFTDGVLIALSWLTSPEMGFSTTLIIGFHEIPQEIGDFSILLNAGFTKRKAIFYNFLVACTAVLGALLTLFVGQTMGNFSRYIVPVVAGGFIYLAASNLLPEIIRSSTRKNVFVRFLCIVFGLLTMYFVAKNGH